MPSAYRAAWYDADLQLLLEVNTMLCRRSPRETPSGNASSEANLAFEAVHQGLRRFLTWFDRTL
jgi:hypothetical protein